MAESGELPISNSIAQTVPENRPSAPTFSEYQSIMLEKDDLKKVVILLFQSNPEELTPQQIASRFTEDKHIVRHKYSLPDEALWLHQPDKYYHQLEIISRKAGIQIKNREEFGDFFKENRLATAVYLSAEDVIAMKKMQESDSLSEIASKSATLEHELIHAFQARRYPGMTLIRKEYEAYVAHGNEEIFITKPWLFLERIALSITPTQLEHMWEQNLDDTKQSAIISEKSKRSSN